MRTMELVDVERRSEDLARYLRDEVERAPMRKIGRAHV